MSERNWRRSSSEDSGEKELSWRTREDESLKYIISFPSTDGDGFFHSLGFLEEDNLWLRRYIFSEVSDDSLKRCVNPEFVMNEEGIGLVSRTLGLTILILKGSISTLFSPEFSQSSCIIHQSSSTGKFLKVKQTRFVMPRDLKRHGEMGKIRGREDSISRHSDYVNVRSFHTNSLQIDSWKSYSIRGLPDFRPNSRLEVFQLSSSVNLRHTRKVKSFDYHEGRTQSGGDSITTFEEAKEKLVGSNNSFYVERTIRGEDMEIFIKSNALIYTTNFLVVDDLAQEVKTYRRSRDPNTWVSLFKDSSGIYWRIKRPSPTVDEGLSKLVKIVGSEEWIRCKSDYVWRRPYYKPELIHKVEDPSLVVPTKADFPELGSATKRKGGNVIIREGFEGSLKTSTLSREDILSTLTVNYNQVIVEISDGGKIELAISDCHKIRHEIVSSCLKLGETDVALSSYFGLLGDFNDSKTPDFIVDKSKAKDKSETRVIEVGTTMRDDNIIRDFHQKTVKYLQALEDRAFIGTEISFFVMIVSPTKYYTNLMIGDDMIQKLSNAIHKGMVIEKELREKGVLIDELKDLSERERIKGSILTQLKEVKFEEISEQEAKENPCLIGENDLLRWKLDEVEFTPISLEKNLQRFKKGEECVKDFLTNYEVDEEERRFSNHPLTIWPSRAPKSNYDSYFIDDSFHSSDSSLLGIWSSISDLPEGSQVKVPFFEEDELGDPVILESGRKGPDPDLSRNRKKNRHLLFTGKDKTKLFKETGLGGKKMNQSKESIEWKKEQQKAFSFQTSTEDIDDFIESDWMFHEEETVSEPWEELYRHSSDRVDSGEHRVSVRVWELFKKTRCGQLLSFIGSVSAEIAYSMKQYCNSPSQFIVKRIPGFNSIVIVKPSTLKGPAWFSFSTDLRCEGKGIFREQVEFSDQRWVSEFYSLSPGRVDHFINSCEAMLAVLCSLCAVWRVPVDVFLLDPMKHPSLMKHFNLSLLVFLEGKSQTSADFLMVRYMYAESLKGLGSYPYPNPFRVLSKFDTRPKSRLLVWLHKSIIRTFSRVVDCQPYIVKTDDLDCDDDREDKNLDNWKDLPSLIKGEMLQYGRQAILLSYLGVLHNKDEEASGKSTFDIYEKIVKMEIPVRDLKSEELKFGEKLSDLKPHEFNYKFIKFTSACLKRALNARAPDLEGLLENSLAEELLRATPESMGTFKSSAPEEFNKADYCYSVGDFELRRPKVIQALGNLLVSKGFKGPLYTNLEKLLELSKDMRVFLFKKNQWGKTREIYILTVVCRLVVYILESVSRIYCKILPSEFLTKGSEKSYITRQHQLKVKTKVAELSKEYSVENMGTFFTSGDCATWCQMFTMPQFALSLFGLIPSYLRPVLTRILNMISRKKIYLANRMLVQFRKYPDVRSFSESLNKLKEDYWKSDEDENGKEECEQPRLIENQGHFLENMSNMMQGICHFTSSLFHAGISESQEVLAKQFVKDMFKEKFTIVVSNSLSSDDFGIQLTILHTRPKGTTLGKKLLKIAKENTERILHGYTTIVSNTYAWSGIKISEKTVQWSKDSLFEFNSVFEIVGSTNCPLLPHAYSSVSLKTSTRLDHRLHLYQNLRAELLEVGMPIENIDIIQLCQARAHYRGLGSNNVSQFSILKRLLIKMPSPSLGFFAKEPSFLAGICGMDYALECHRRVWVDFRRIQQKIDETMETDVQDDGVKSFPINLYQGGHYLYKRFQNVVDSWIDWEDKIGEDPSILYRFCYEDDENLTKLCIKANSPGAAENFHRNTSLGQFISGVFMLTSPSLVFFLRKTNLTGLDLKEKTHYKASLIDILRLFERTIALEPPPEFLSANDVHPIYERLELSLSKGMFRQYSQAKNRKIRITVPKSSTDIMYPLVEIVKKVWFNIPIRVSSGEIERVFLFYQTKIPFLRDSVEETLAESPFTDHIALRNFVARYEEKKFKTISILGPGKVTSSVETSLLRTISRCYRPGYMLLEVKKETKSSSRTESIRKSHELTRALCLNYIRPADLKKNPRSILAREDLQVLPEGETLENFCLLHKSIAPIAVMQAIIKETSSERVVEILKNVKMGVVGGFLERQSKEPEEGSRLYEGKGIYRMQAGLLECTLILQDDSLIEVHINSQKNFYMNLAVVKKMLLDFGIKNSMSASPDWEGLRYSFKEGRLLSDKSSGEGCKVLVSPIVWKIPDIMNKMKVELDSKGILRVLSKGEGKTPWVVVLSHNLPLRLAQTQDPDQEKIYSSEVLEKLSGKLSRPDIVNCVLNEKYRELGELDKVEDEESVPQIDQFITNLARSKLQRMIKLSGMGRFLTHFSSEKDLKEETRIQKLLEEDIDISRLTNMSNLLEISDAFFKGGGHLIDGTASWFEIGEEEEEIERGEVKTGMKALEDFNQQEFFDILEMEEGKIDPLDSETLMEYKNLISQDRIETMDNLKEFSEDLSNFVSSTMEEWKRELSRKFITKTLTAWEGILEPFKPRTEEGEALHFLLHGLIESTMVEI